jgi:phage shock protein PspC (stress-responsive transcriptional regulator)
MNNTKKLYRSKTDRIIFGVCGGLGEYFEIDSLVIRLLFLLLTITGGAGAIIYIVMAIIVPVEGGKEKEKKEKEDDGSKQPAEKAEEMNGKRPRKWHSETRSVIGFIIVLIGLNILFEQIFKFSPLYWVNWGVVWSLIIIFIGLRLFSR